MKNTDSEEGKFALNSRTFLGLLKDYPLVCKVKFMKNTDSEEGKFELNSRTFQGLLKTILWFARSSL